MIELPINLDELAFVLHRGPELKMECFLDLENGEVIYVPTELNALNAMYHSIYEPGQVNVKALARDILRKETALKYIPDNFSQVVYDLMNGFIESQFLPDYLQSKLVAAIHGQRGFDEFHALLQAAPRYLKKFLDFRDHFFRKKALCWLKENHIVPLGLASD